MTQWQQQQRGLAGLAAEEPGTSSAAIEAAADGLSELIYRVHQRLIRDLDSVQLGNLEPERARQAVEAAAKTLLGQESHAVVGELRDEIVAAVADEVLGYGPIDPLVRDASVSEVMVNA